MKNSYNKHIFYLNEKKKKIYVIKKIFDIIKTIDTMKIYFIEYKFILIE